MIKNKPNIRFISFIYEGKTEKEVISSIIHVLYNCRKFRICNQHTHTINGTIGDDIKKKEPKNCCQTFVIIDLDDISNNKLQSIQKDCKDTNSTLILSNPCIEINWLAAFKDVSVKNWNKSDIYSQLKKELSISKNDDFNKVELALKIVKILKSNPEKLANWENNLLKLKQKTKNNNFYDLIELIK